ncbi:hypothetical protein LCGC14_1701030, partial [marine sediment metagenome]
MVRYSAGGGGIIAAKIDLAAPRSPGPPRMTVSHGLPEECREGLKMTETTGGIRWLRRMCVSLVFAVASAAGAADQAHSVYSVC